MKAAPKLLEPIMRASLDALVYIGDVNRRPEQPPRPGHTEWTHGGQCPGHRAMVPLANMFDMSILLRSISHGRAQYTMHFRPL